MGMIHSDGTECDGASTDCVREMHFRTDPQISNITVLRILELSVMLNMLSNRGISKPRSTTLKVAAVMLFCSKELVGECRKASPDMANVRDTLAQSMDRIVDLTREWVD